MKTAWKTFARKLPVILVLIAGVLLATIRFNFFDAHKIPFLTTAYIAHRGVYQQPIPENSLSAFQNAIDRGLSIELDVSMTKDGYPIIFHDDRLERLTNGHGFVKDTNLADLKQLLLGSSDEKIPTLEQALKLVDGQVALLIEIKNRGLPGRLEQRVLHCLKNYRGSIAIQSFNPFVVRWFKQKASYDVGLILGETRIKRMRLFRDNLYTFIAFPNFLVYQYDLLTQDKPLMMMRKDSLLIIPYTLNAKNTGDLKAQNFDTAIIHFEQ